MGKMFLNLTDKEEKKLRWLIGFFVGTHVVSPTFKNRAEWSKEKIVEELRGALFEVIYTKFTEWMKKRSEKATHSMDEILFQKISESQLLETEIKALIYFKIPELSKEYDKERKGFITRRLIKEQVSPKEWELIIEKFDCKCAYCGSDESITQDHVIPISKGGAHAITNLLPACKKCNSSKNDHCWNEWYSKQTFYSEERQRKILSHIGSENK